MCSAHVGAHNYANIVNLWRIVRKSQLFNKLYPFASTKKQPLRGYHSLRGVTSDIESN
jgi:hypothetical protein